jgi:hypothetical protein
MLNSNYLEFSQNTLLLKTSPAYESRNKNQACGTTIAPFPVQV